MPRGLRRFQESRQSHFVTFSCYRRQPYFARVEAFDLFVHVLEAMRRRFQMRVYGYVVMPEHVRLLISEPPPATPLAEAIHYLKLSFAKRMRSLRTPCQPGRFWQKRYYDRNVRDSREFTIKLRYLHRNPVKRGLVVNPEDWKWGSYRHYARGRRGKDRVGMDGQGSGTAGQRNRRDEDIPLPRLASKERTRTWGTRLHASLLPTLAKNARMGHPLLP
jgi:putative transposase